MVSVVKHNCSFLLISQNYLSYGVCHYNTGTIYLNTWFSGDHSVRVYVCVLEMGMEACPPFNKQGTAFFACEGIYCCACELCKFIGACICSCTVPSL